MEDIRKTPAVEKQSPADMDTQDGTRDAHNAGATVPAPDEPTADADPNFAINGE